MNAVGIDVSKGRSTVAILRPMGEVVMTPEDVFHEASKLDGLADRILSLEGDTKVLMEATGRYHETIASELHERGIFVSVVNPILIHHYNPDSTVRKVKTDKKDSVKIAKYCLEHWNDLREYSPMDTIRQQLKLFSRQYNLYMKNNVSLQNNLISLSDKTFPGIDTLFSSPERADGHQKWVDFFTTFWHVKCVAGISKEAFVERYQKWCRRNGYNFSAGKASEVYDYSLRQLTTLPKTDVTKLLIQTAAKELTSANELLASLRQEMNRLARQLPEYDVVRAMYGVGDITAAQLIAEIGDVRRFPRRSSIVGFAGVDPEVEQSGKSTPEGKPATKRGSPHLRKTLYQIMTIYLQRAPADEPVYQFLDKKRSEGKPYNVYMTAGANKFLRIYYARVKERLQMLDSGAGREPRAAGDVLDDLLQRAPDPAKAKEKSSMKRMLTYIGSDSWSRHVYEDENGKLWKHTDCCVPKEVCQERGDRLYSSCGNTLDGEPDWPMEEGVECEFIDPQDAKGGGK